MSGPRALRGHAGPVQEAGATRARLATLVAVLCGALALNTSCDAQSIDRADREPGSLSAVTPEVQGATSWLTLDEMRQVARAEALRQRASLFIDEAGAGRIETGAGWALAQREKWHTTLGVESYELASPEQVRAVGQSVYAPERSGLVPGHASAAALMSPVSLIAPAHQGFHNYTGLRLTSSDVLLRGDRVTLRAGSDLHLLIQGLGLDDWTNGAAALAGFASRMELRWARPAAVGEFAVSYQVDRKAGEFRHEHLLAGWAAHF